MAQDDVIIGFPSGSEEEKGVLMGTDFLRILIPKKRTTCCSVLLSLRELLRRPIESPTTQRCRLADSDSDSGFWIPFSGSWICGGAKDVVVYQTASNDRGCSMHRLLFNRFHLQINCFARKIYLLPSADDKIKGNKDDSGMPFSNYTTSVLYKSQFYKKYSDNTFKHF